MSTDTDSPTRGTLRRVVDLLTANEKLVYAQSIVGVMLLWTIVSHGFGLEARLSSPLLIWEFFYPLLLSMEWVPHLFDSFRRVIYAFVVAMIFGVGVGLALGLSRFWEFALMDYVSFFMAVPSLFVAVFAAMWFGISDITPLVAASVTTWAFVAQITFQAVNSIDHRLFEMASTFEISRRRVLVRIVAKSVLAELFSAARYGHAVCWKLVALTELFAASSGVGFQINHYFNTYNLEGIYSWTLFVVFIIVAVEYGVIQPVERRLFRWKPQATFGWV